MIVKLESIKVGVRHSLSLSLFYVSKNLSSRFISWLHSSPHW